MAIDTGFSGLGICCRIIPDTSFGRNSPLPGGNEPLPGRNERLSGVSSALGLFVMTDLTRPLRTNRASPTAWADHRAQRPLSPAIDEQSCRRQA